MNYYRELAFALRVRGLSEDTIRSTLDDVRMHSAEAGQDPSHEFGPPDRFAENFEKGGAHAAGRRFVVVMTVVALAVVIGLFVLSKAMGAELRVGVFSIPLFAGVVVAVAGFVGGFLLDRRLPAGFGVEKKAA